MACLGRPVLALVLGLVGARGAQLRRQEGAAAAPLQLTQQLTQLKEGAWVPDDLLVVDQAIRGLLNMKLSKEKHQAVQEAADRVKKDLEPVTGDKKLSREERRAKVGAALKEIQGLSVLLTPPPPPAAPQNVTAIKAKLTAMKQELAEKTATLGEEQKELKLDVLKKELMEKKLQLQRLLNMKKEAEHPKLADAEDMKAQTNMVAKLVDMAKAMSEEKHGEKAAAKPDAPAKPLPTALQAIESDLEKRTLTLKADIANIDAQEKKIVEDMDAVAATHMPTLNKDDALAKGQVLLDSLKRDEHRKFEKARAMKRAELAELSHAIASIKTGDVKALTQILSRMQHETKNLDARSGHFLH